MVGLVSSPGSLGGGEREPACPFAKPLQINHGKSQFSLERTSSSACDDVSILGDLHEEVDQAYMYMPRENFQTINGTRNKNPG